MFTYGLVNSVNPIFSGFATFVSMIRTPLNVQLGCKSQLGGLVSGVTILMVACFGSSIIKLVPIPLISAIVAFSAFFNMIDLTMVITCFKYYPKDFVMFIVTFGLSLAFPLADAILLSAIISLLWILKRNSKPTWFLQ